MYNTTNTTFAGNRDAANRTVRFDIRKGKFAQWMGPDQQRQEYDFVQGYLSGISLRKRETSGGEMTYMDLHFVSGGVRFDVSAIASLSVAGMSSRTGFIASWRPTLPPRRGWTATASV